MGELTRLRGNQYRYTIRDFRIGLTAYGPQSITLGDTMQSDALTTFSNCSSESGRLEPIIGDAYYNSTSFSVGGSAVDYLFPYIRQDGNGLLLLVGYGGNLFEHPTSGSSTTITSLVTLNNSGTARYGAQALGYNYISGSSLTLLRYCHANPGSGGKLSFAGTKAPTNAPTSTLRGAGSLTSSTGYVHRYAWEYGVTSTDGRGELGMGWKQNSSIVTCTAVSTSISVTMDASPPSDYSHVVARSVWRNTTAYQESFFLVTRTAYSGSALPTSYLDTSADSSIELGEETDPIVGQTVTAPIYSELLPPRMQFVATHEGRLWGLDITVNGTRYPHRVVYSRIAGIAPHFDQFDLSANIPAADASVGLPTGLVAWMGNLYALFERGICILSSDPGPGRIPSFSQVVYGRGCINAKTIAACPDGIVMLSSEGVILFNGGPIPVPLSEDAWTLMRGYSSVGSAGYEPLYREYSIGLRFLESEPVVFVYGFRTKRWSQWSDTGSAGQSLANWNYTCQAGSDLVYGLATAGGPRVYKRKRGTLQASLLGSNLNMARQIMAHSTDFGLYGTKWLRDITIELNGPATLTDSGNSITAVFRSVLGLTTLSSLWPQSNSVTTHRLVFNPATSIFNAMQWGITVSGAFPENVPATCTIEAVHLNFVHEPNRIMFGGQI